MPTNGKISNEKMKSFKSVLMAVFLSLIISSCCPVWRFTLPLSFEEQSEVSGVSTRVRDITFSTAKKYILIDIDSDRDRIFHKDSLYVRLGSSNVKYEGGVSNSMYGGDMRILRKGKQTMSLILRKPRVLKETLKFAVRFSGNDHETTLLRVLPDDILFSMYNFHLSLLERSYYDFGDTRLRLSIYGNPYRMRATDSLRTSVFCMMLVEQMRQEDKSRNTIRVPWPEGLEVEKEGLRLEYDRELYDLSLDDRDMSFMRNGQDKDYAIYPSVSFWLKRRDGGEVTRIPDISILPSDAIMYNGRRLVGDTIHIDGDKADIEDVPQIKKLFLSEKKDAPRVDDKWMRKLSSLPYHVLQIGNGLIFSKYFTDCTLSLLRNDVPVYENVIDKHHVVAIPLSLSGTYEMRVTCGDTIYGAEITF